MIKYLSSLKKSKILSDSLLYFLAKLAPGISGFLSITLFLSFLNKEQYGKYSLIFSSVVMITSCAVTWLNQSQLKYHSIYSDKVSDFSFAVKQSYLYCIVFIVFVLILASFFLRADVEFLELMVCLSLSISLMLYQVSTTSLQARLEPLKFVKSEVLRAVTFICFPVLFVLHFNQNDKSQMVLAGIAFSYFLSAAVLSDLKSIFKTISLLIIKATFLFKNRQNLSFLHLLNNYIRKYFNLIIHYAKPSSVVKDFFVYGFPITIWILFF
jgi:O-antigen/teichoic acid export membrane protein